MEEASQRTRRLRFGVFELDLASGELRKQGLKVKLQEQPFQVISVLLEHAGEVVTREELRQRLWPEDTFVDFEHSLATAVNKIREALGDTAQSPRFVETLPRRGYRFIAPVEPLDLRPPTSAKPTAEAMGTRPEASKDRSSQPAVQAGASPLAAGAGRFTLATRRRLKLVGGSAGALVVIFGLLVAFNVAGLRQRLMSLAGPRPGAASPRIGSMAVLPLTNVSGDTKEDYFADGMTDELIATLGGIHSLRVISRTSVQQFKKTDKTVPQIAGELGVEAILEGTVLQAGGRVRITAELMSAEDRQLWAGSLESDERDVLLLQDEMAREIADRVKVRIQAGEQARLAAAHPVDPGAHENYLEGLFYYYRETPQDLPKAIQYLQQAVRLKPDYAEAYALLAACYYDSSQSRWGNVPNAVAAQEAKATALKALTLDESLAEPHVVLGAVAEGQEWDWTAAGNEFKHAIELDPNLVTAHVGYAWHLAFVGRPEEAVREVNRAAELDPVSSYALLHRATILFQTRHYKQAIEEAHKAIQLFPSNPLFYSALGIAYYQEGRHAEAVAAWQNQLKRQGEKPAAVAALGIAFKKGGIRGVWQWQLSHLNAERAAGGDQGHSYAIAVYCSLLGEKDKALVQLDKLYTERGQDVALARIDPRFDNLRSDPRFRALMQRMNFPQ